tara:strand:+ start:684 stop:1955 length:1272 start_codon:yes stop_codon:yes gene_type:complete
MNKLKLFLLIVLISPMTNAAIELLDKVAVIVEDGIILESEVNKRIEQIIESLKQSDTPLPPQEVLFEQIIERMIIEEIQLQKAQMAGVRISDQELNESMAQIAQGNGLSLQDFRSFLEEQGESYEFVREQVRKEMILSRIQRGLVQSKVYISEQELDNFINSQEGQVNLSAEFLIQQILIPINKDQDEKTASSVIDSLKEKISQKMDFGDLAKEYSFGEEADNEGSLGWRKINEIPTLFANEISSLRKGDIAGPFRSGAGLHLIKLKDKKGRDIKIEKQTLARHILIQTSEIRSEKQAKDLIEDLYKRSQNEDKFSDLARLYSDDPGSKMEGGELSWTGPGRFDPKFEEVMNSLEINQVSKPFKSNFGWHIVEVLDRREEDISLNIQKNRAYQILFDRKYEEQLEKTLSEMRAESYVNIKIKS